MTETQDHGQPEHARPKEKHYEVVINGTLFELNEDTVTFTRVTETAYPGHDPAVMFTVTYRNAIAAHGGNGMLVAGESVKVKKKGTSFDVRLTTRS